MSDKCKDSECTLPLYSISSQTIVKKNSNLQQFFPSTYCADATFSNHHILKLPTNEGKKTYSRCQLVEQCYQNKSHIDK